MPGDFKLTIYIFFKNIQNIVLFFLQKIFATTMSESCDNYDRRRSYTDRCDRPRIYDSCQTEVQLSEIKWEIRDLKKYIESNSWYVV